MQATTHILNFLRLITQEMKTHEFMKFCCQVEMFQSVNPLVHI